MAHNYFSFAKEQKIYNKKEYKNWQKFQMNIHHNQNSSLVQSDFMQYADLQNGNHSIRNQQMATKLFRIHGLLVQVKILDAEQKKKCFIELYWHCWETLGREANFSTLLAMNWKLFQLQETLVSLVEYSKQINNSQALLYFSQGFENLLSATEILDGCRAQKVDLAQRLFFLLGTTAAKQRYSLIKTILRVMKYSPQATQSITQKYGKILLTFIFENYNHSYEYFLSQALSRFKVPLSFVYDLKALIQKNYDAVQTPNFPSREAYRKSLERIMMVIKRIYPQDFNQFIHQVNHHQVPRRIMNGPYSMKQNLDIENTQKHNLLTEKQFNSDFQLYHNSFQSISDDLSKLSVREDRENSMELLIHQFQAMMPRKMAKK